MSSEPLAVVGMACRFPQGEDEWEYWRLLVDGRSAITEIPPDRWNADAFYHPEMGRTGKMCTRWGGFLRDIDGFDADLFGVPSHESRRMDPQQRLTMEVGWEALEDAGLFPPSLAGTNTAVVLAIAHGDHNRLHYRDLDTIDAFNGTNTYLSVAANRLSFALDLRGPSLAVDTACSSSIYALYMARLLLESRRSDRVLVGATNLNLSPEEFISLSHAGLMAKDGRCKTFDAAGDGYVRGEGCAFFVLRRMDDAQTSGERIRCTVAGLGVNVNGRTNGLTAPRGEAQREVIRTAWTDAGIGPGQLGMIEVHGTGTVFGDRIEAKALAQEIRASAPDLDVWAGTAKGNVGHLEAASGMAGLVKLLLAMEHGVVPPQLNLENPSEGIPLGQGLAVPSEPATWPVAARYGAVSAFGFGGANGHAVLGRVPAPAVDPRPPGDLAFMVSARTEKALELLEARLSRHLTEHPKLDPMAVARTLASSRAEHAHRRAYLCKDLSELSARLSGTADRGTAIAGHAGWRAPKLAVWRSGDLHERSTSLGLPVEVYLDADSVGGFLTRSDVGSAPQRWRILDPWRRITGDLAQRFDTLGVPVLRGSESTDADTAWLAALMQYWVAGGGGTWARLFSSAPLLSLPHYPFQRERYERAPFTPLFSAPPQLPEAATSRPRAERGIEDLTRIVQRILGDGVPLLPERSLREHGLDSIALVSLQADLVALHGPAIKPLLDADVPLSRLADSIAAFMAERPTTPAQRPEPLTLSGSDFVEFSALQAQLASFGDRSPFFVPSLGTNGATTNIGTGTLINFSSYNYLGLSGHPEVVAAAADAISRYGTSVSASRLVSGERPVHVDLEHEISQFLGTPAAIVFVGGHATNVSVIGHLATSQDVILNDDLIHNSCMEGAIRSGSFQRPFRHNDPEHLEFLLRRHRNDYRRAFVLVEGVYSMDGDVTPLAGIVAAAKRWKCVTMVDEAHSIGTMGAHGRGVAEHLGVDPADVDLWMGTLSKSLASCGGYIAGTREIVTYLKYTCPGFVYSVGMSPANGAAALAALRVLKREPERCRTLQHNGNTLRKWIREAGWSTGLSADDTPVVPLIIGDAQATIELSRRLLDRGVYVLPVIPPAVAPESSRLRFFVSRDHTSDQLRRTIECLEHCRSRTG